MADRIDTLQRIELAEGVEVRLRTAGPFVRGAAWLADLMIQLVIMFLVGLVVNLMAASSGNETVPTGIFLLLGFALIWFYNVFFEIGKHGATPGKRWMGLRVVQTSGIPVKITHSITRNFVRIIDGFPLLPLASSSLDFGNPTSLPTYGLGVAVCLFTKNFQRLGDLAAGTVVVYTEPFEVNTKPMREPIQPLRPLFVLNKEEQLAILMYLERASTFSDARKEELADNVDNLTGQKGRGGVRTLLGIGLWLRDSN